MQNIFEEVKWVKGHKRLQCEQAKKSQIGRSFFHDDRRISEGQPIFWLEWFDMLLQRRKVTVFKLGSWKSSQETLYLLFVI